jgi:hypothetical protein
MKAGLMEMNKMVLFLSRISNMGYILNIHEKNRFFLNDPDEKSS